MHALSKRIHYGKFIAEAKFRASLDDYEATIRARVRIILSLNLFIGIYLMVVKKFDFLIACRIRKANGIVDVSYCGGGNTNMC